MYYEYGPVLKGTLIVTSLNVENAIQYFTDWFGITEDDQTDMILTISEYTFLNTITANGLDELSILN